MADSSTEMRGGRRATDKQPFDPFECQGGCDDIITVKKQLVDGDERMDRIESDLQELLEIVRMGKSFFKLLGVIGSFIKWAAPILTAVGTVIYMFRTGGK